ncbi:MAG: AAA family ATPase [Acidobacteria bacterium]|nr:AAA family ATPase [Acidobacteriota bacterium]
MKKRRLPTGIQNFRQIREEGYYYVDKTPYALRLAEGAGKHYFLSRPRRFGKSLFVDTLKELYEGSEPLFRGLAVHDAWDWSRRRAVVRLSFAGGNFKRPGALLESARAQIEDLARRGGVDAGGGSAAVRFRRLIEGPHDRTGERVVVLVDEYDKPILDARDDPRLPAGTPETAPHDGHAQATANRDDLRGLYGTLKDCDAHVERTFLTGVSKFSKVSLFSDLNFLTDLTLDPRYAAVCGYTEADLDAIFAPELPGLDREQIRAWYNGYNWHGAESVYNPWAILHLFQSREFKAHWFETATPRFLVDTLIERGFSAPDLEGLHADDDLLSALDVASVGTEALLFQAGYLTIAAEEKLEGYAQYRLGYPNREVRRGLNRGVLDALAPRWRSAGSGVALRRLLAAGDWTGLEALFRTFLAAIPHDRHRRNEIARYEGYWSSVFYAWFQASMDGVAVEDATSRGRLDMAVVLGDVACVFELKVTERAARDTRSGTADGDAPASNGAATADHAALAQLKARRYGDKYRARNRTVYLIGVEIGTESRDLTAFDVEPV